MTLQHSPSDIYVTKLDYERLTHLVRREHASNTNRLVANLEQELSRAHLVDSYDILPDVITMNSRLKLRAMNNGEELHFTLVYPPDADEGQQRVSILNPVGMAVLGCRLGDQVRLPQVKGVSTYWVEAILHQPEAAGDWVS
jgi:regulator of nucleoside diphosphate kinase